MSICGADLVKLLWEDREQVGSYCKAEEPPVALGKAGCWIYQHSPLEQAWSVREKAQCQTAPK